LDKREEFLVKERLNLEIEEQTTTMILRHQEEFE